MKSKFELAEQSVESKRLERYQDAEDECYGFMNQFPDSKDKALAEKYIKRCKSSLGRILLTISLQKIIINKYN